MNISEDSTSPFKIKGPSANTNRISNIRLQEVIQATTIEYQGSMKRNLARNREYQSQNRSRNVLERETFELRYALVRAACVAHWLHQLRGKIPKQVSRTSAHTVLLDMYTHLCEVDRKMVSLDIDVYKLMCHETEEAMSQFLSRAKFRSDSRYRDVYDTLSSRRARGQGLFYCHPEHESGIPSIREQLCGPAGIRLVNKYVEILPTMLYKNDKREDRDIFNILELFAVNRKTAGDLGITSLRWQERTMDRIVQEVDDTSSELELEDFSDSEGFAEATGVTLHPSKSDRFDTPARTSTPEPGEILEIQRVEVSKKSRVKDSPDTEDMEVVEIQPSADHVPVKGHDTRTAVNACMKLLLEMRKLQLEFVPALQRLELSDRKHTEEMAVQKECTKTMMANLELEFVPALQRLELSAKKHTEEMAVQKDRTKTMMANLELEFVPALQRLELSAKKHTEEMTVHKECTKTMMANQEILKKQHEARMIEDRKKTVELTISREQMQILVPTMTEEMRELKKDLEIIRKEPLERKNKVIENMKKTIEEQTKVLNKRDGSLEEVLKEMTNARKINVGIKEEVSRGMTKLQDLQQAQGSYLQAQVTKQEDLSKKITRFQKETKEHAEGLNKKITKQAETQHQERMDSLSSCFSNLRTINEKVSKEATTLARMEEQTKQFHTSMGQNVPGSGSESQLSKLEKIKEEQTEVKKAVISLQKTQDKYQAKKNSDKEGKERRGKEMIQNQVMMLELLHKFQLVTPTEPSPGQPAGTLLIPAGEQQVPMQASNMSEDVLLSCPTDEIIPGGDTDNMTDNERCWQEGLALEGCYPPPSKSQRRDSTPTASANVGKIAQGETEQWTASVNDTGMEQPGKVAPIKIKREPGLDIDMINEVTQMVQPVRYAQPTGNE